MYSKFHLACKYLQYFISASNGRGHGVHSPFIFQFIKNVLNDRSHYKEYDAVEDMRDRLKMDNTKLKVDDLGVGSAITNNIERKVSSIARSVVKPKKYGQLLYRIVRHFQPNTIIELGTSLGITTSYLASANSKGKVISIEGSSEVLETAKQNIKALKLQNIELILGNFNNILPEIAERLEKIDFCFIDGNHRREPTERYFKQLLKCMQKDSILVIDDIHWSEEMEQAWRNIKNNSEITCTIDLFFIGIVLFRPEFREKQHFVIRF